MSATLSFFHARQKLLFLLASLYVILMTLSHWQLPSAHVWLIAGFFSVIMNFTYLTEALSLRQFVRIETLVATVLIGLSLLGAFWWPPLVIAAIFGHGCWDIAKHLGAGVPFFSWYTLSCFGVDFLYSGSLLFYWMS